MDNDQYWLDQFSMLPSERDRRYADLNAVPHHLRTLKVCELALDDCPFNLIYVPVHLRNDEIVQRALDKIEEIMRWYVGKDYSYLLKCNGVLKEFRY